MCMFKLCDSVKLKMFVDEGTYGSVTLFHSFEHSSKLKFEN